MIKIVKSFKVIHELLSSQNLSCISSKQKHEFVNELIHWQPIPVHDQYDRRIFYDPLEQRFRFGRDPQENDLSCGGEELCSVLCSYFRYPPPNDIPMRSS